MARKKLKVRRKGYWRKAYTRSDGVRVKRTWVPATTFMVADRGKPGRGPKTIKIRSEGALGGPGYAEKSARARHAELRKSVRRDGYARTARRIAAIRGLGKRTMSRKDLQTFEADQKWLRDQYGDPPKKRKRTKRKKR